MLPDGRWFDPLLHTWCDDKRRDAVWPDVVEACRIRKARVILAACHKDHAPANVKARNVAVWYRRHTSCTIAIITGAGLG